MNKDQLSLLHGMQDIVAKELDLLLEIDKAWQPTDYLPNFAAEDWRDQVESYRAPALNVDDPMLVVLVGDMVTEEALPSYSVSLNALVRDQEGDASTPWAKWLRGWTAEEN